jgi:glyoxylase-like metal-dependent hydrolase (beta-lactamase superfamily II)
MLAFLLLKTRSRHEGYDQGGCQRTFEFLMTHGHVDHAMGSAEFADCYMNLQDAYIYEEHGKMEFRKAGFAGLGTGDSEITDEDIIPTAPLSHYRDMKGGDSFDLGEVLCEALRHFYLVDAF